MELENKNKPKSEPDKEFTKTTAYFNYFKAFILILAGILLSYIAIRNYAKGVPLDNEIYHTFGEEGVLVGALGFGLIFIFIGLKMIVKSSKQLKKLG